ncbi:DUF6443 domain-containing protein [Jejuia spongiicola]|uniref:DUF6443 domain-containing protein n=1 Tax=Jejuia spongiicola TaxID=2942207 RepID=A0ABT0QD55_9FLAO|nr:DUF6443 domain-containing protein [Jejuia spongiicola]MCL6294916.1 DUF6443 domain-containing protein [Jejuia spongiicola]
MIRLFNTFLQHKIMLSVFMLFFFCSFTQAQVTGPTAVDTHSTHRYYYDDGISYAFNNWVVSGPYTSAVKGNTGTNYYVDVAWAGVGTGSVTFRKKTIVLSTLANIVISVPAPTSGPSPDQNYVHTTTPKIATTNVSSLSNTDKIESIAYFDGLGRAMQSVGIRAGGNGEDIITHVGYDEYGRQAKDYLPYTASSTDGSFRTDGLSATNTYYDATKYEADFPSVTVSNINAYSEKEFEASPLNRVLKQAAPGKDWKLGNGHEIEFNYQTNHSTEVRFYDVSLAFANNTYTPTLQGGTTYFSAGTLYKTVTKDENHDGTSTKNHTTEEFKDKQGRVILKRTYNNSVAHDTYYVYDKFGNLSYVLPPKAEPQTTKPDATELSELCYQYKYDHKSRLVEKKIPGKGWEYIVYNKLDQPIYTQDANLDAQNKWLFTKYDAFGRIAFTGTFNNSGSRITLQNSVDNASSAYTQFEQKLSSPQTIAGVLIYYTNTAFPHGVHEIYTINYYDNYTFDKISGNSESSYGVTPETNAKGLATGSKVRVLGTSDWITTVSYYDDKSRPIYVYSFNDYLNTTDKVKSKLDFTGTVDETTTTHAKTGQSTITTIDYFTYDDAGRLITQKQKINSLAEETIVQNNYDDLGQLISKGVGGKTTQGRLQNVDYTYNIRGWLKQINNPISLGSDLFGFKINYNESTEGYQSVDKLYNGNISQTIWKTANDNVKRGYAYAYDDLNRITNGHSSKGSTLMTGDSFSIWGIAYDKNGNISRISRAGKYLSATQHIDELYYTYSNNKLLKVIDARSGSVANEGFKDGTNTGNDYTYDANGNMRTDLNKGISSNITYNHLNLPTLVTLSGGNISYIYDATGVKLKKIVSTGATTEYAGNYVYEGGSLKFFNHPEGYVDVNGSSYSYVYQYKDHLGNVRLSYKSDSSVTPVNVDDDFNSGTDGWSHTGSGSVSSSNQKLNISTINKYHKASKYLTITPNVPIHIEFDFEKGSMNLPYFFVQERINGVWESNSNRDAIANMSDGHYTLDLTLTGDYIRIYFEKGNSSDDGTLTTCYVDNFKLTQNGLEILEENNYYPFGLKHKGYNNVGTSHLALNWKYNGTEYEEALDLNLYEMPLRQYDPAIARWTSIDPVVHHSMSTYTAFDNNPVYWADPSGADSVDDWAAEKQGEWAAYDAGASARDVWGSGRMMSSNSNSRDTSSDSESSFCDAECQLRNTKREFKAHSIAFDMVGLDKDSKEYKRLSRRRASYLAMISDAKVQELAAPTDPLGIILHFGTLGIASRFGIGISGLRHLGKTRIFYVGEGAEAAARALAQNDSGMMTIYNTWYGRLGETISPYLSKTNSRAMWDKFSYLYARGANSAHTIFGPQRIGGKLMNSMSINSQSAWRRVEYRTLFRRGIEWSETILKGK